MKLSKKTVEKLWSTTAEISDGTTVSSGQIKKSNCASD